MSISIATDSPVSSDAVAAPSHADAQTAPRANHWWASQSEGEYVNYVRAPLHEQGAVNHPALTPIHWWDGCDIRPHKSERLDALAPLAAAFYTGEAAEVISAARGKTRNGDVAHAWGLAIGAVYGPIGAHESQGEHPEVIKFKARCLAALRTYLSV